MTPLDDDDLTPDDNGGRRSRDYEAGRRKEPYETLRDKQPKRKLIKRSVLKRPGRPPEVKYDEDIRILGRPVKGKRLTRDYDKFLNAYTESFTKGMTPYVNRYVQDAINNMFAERGLIQTRVQLGGATLKIDKDDLWEMADTFNTFGGDLLRGSADVVGGALYEALNNGLDTVNREVFEDIGKAAAQHMQTEAYRTQKELKGGALRRHVPTAAGVARGMTRTEYLDAWTVSRGQGYNVRVFRTGHLKKSIGYSIKMDPEAPAKRSKKQWKKHEKRFKAMGRPLSGPRSFMEHKADYEARRKQAISVSIGPGAGKTIAPHYALIVNDGVPPQQGMHFVLRDRRGKPSMFVSGVWQGFEPKYYLERTGQWLVRDYQKMSKIKARNIMRIQVKRAFDTVRSEVGEEIYKKLLADLMHKTEKELEDIAEERTHKMIIKVAAMLEAGTDKWTN